MKIRKVCDRKKNRKQIRKFLKREDRKKLKTLEIYNKKTNKIKRGA